MEMAGNKSIEPNVTGDSATLLTCLKAPVCDGQTKREREREREREPLSYRNLIIL